MVHEHKLEWHSPAENYNRQADGSTDWLGCTCNMSPQEIVDELQGQLTKIRTSWPLEGHEVPDVAEAVTAEMADYQMVLHNAAEVFMEASGGQISKPNTLASQVIELMNEKQQKEENESAEYEFEVVGVKVTSIRDAAMKYLAMRRFLLELVSAQQSSDPRWMLHSFRGRTGLSLTHLMDEDCTICTLVEEEDNTPVDVGV